MPMSWAAPLSSEQARMALPILVLLVNDGQRQHDDNAGRDGQQSDVGHGELAAEQLARRRCAQREDEGLGGSAVQISRAAFWRK